MGPRPLVALSLGWLLVVTVVAAVTFVVVDRAGRGVGQASAARTVAPLPTDQAVPPSPGATPEVPPAPTPSGGETTAVRPVEPRTVSFTTPGGTVVASCAGAELSLESITPFDGWRFEEDTEHDGFEVAFVPGGDGDDEVEIILACVGGSPQRVSK